MDKRAVFLVLLLAVFLAFTISGVSRSSEKVKVVVYFKDAPAAETGPFSAQGVNSLSVSNAASLPQLKAVSAGKMNIKREFSSFSGFTAEVTNDDYGLLKSNPNLDVYKEQILHIQLADSVNLVNATRAHSLFYNNTNITGNTVGVCVLDTGINYSHSALGGCTNDTFEAGNCGKVPGGFDFVNNDGFPLDDNGHGSHVAGIVASTDSTYPGVAPNASIIAIKVCDSAGECSSNDIINGMDWCVNNATKYNISVISMSLGGAVLFSEHCDNNATEGASSFRTPIDSATINNISVVISAGNSGSTTGISSPACITNATAVSSSTKADGFSPYNRNKLTDLLAPGTSITSVDYDGTFTSLSGTSMAAPHVSGAYALLAHYLKAERNATVNETFLKHALNSTGVALTDLGGSGITFYRISVYDAIAALDNTPPNLTFVSPTPANSSANVDNSSIFINITGSEILTVALLEWSNGSVANYSMSGSGVGWFINFSTTVLVNVTYRVFANDSAGNIGVTETRYLYLNNTAPSITSFFPSNSILNITEPANQTFNISYTDANGDLVNVTWLQNGSVVSYNTVNFTFLGNLTASNETLNSTYNITAQVSDGINMSFINWTLSVANNYAPVLSSIANITVNETDWVNVTFSAADANGDLMNFSLNDTRFNASGANAVSANFTWLTNLTSSGFFQIQFNVTDGHNLVAGSFNVTVLDQSDFDGDGIPDIYDDDDDNDGIPDDEDSILGNITSLLVNTAALNSFNLTINGTDNYSRAFTAPALVNVTNGSRSLALFLWNFSASNLSLNQTFEVENASSGRGYILIKGLTLPSSQTKNVTVSNINDAVDSVCVHDAEIGSIGDVSAACTGSNETLVECPGSSGGYSCTLTQNNTLYSVSGLSFSGVVEQCRDADVDGYGTGCASGSDCNDADSSKTTDCSTPPVTSSGGGGGGGGGGSAKVAASDSASQFFKMVDAGSAAVMKVKKAAFSVQKITFTALEQINSATITVEKINSSQAPSGLDGVFQYFNITSTAGSSLIGEVVFDFRVNKSWFASGSFNKDSVLMQRSLNGRWVPLSTSLAGETSLFYNYTATSPGFSYFAITAKPLRPVIQEKPEKNMTVLNVSESVNFSVAEAVAGAEMAGEPEAQFNILFVLFAVASAFMLLIVGMVIGGKIRKKRRVHHQGQKHG